MTGAFLLLLALAAADPQASTVSTAAATSAAKAKGDPDKMICKKFLETGSLVKGTRICKTKADWDRDRDNIQAGYNSAASCRTNNGQSCF